jgi:hypothetical protein
MNIREILTKVSFNDIYHRIESFKKSSMLKIVNELYILKIFFSVQKFERDVI